MLLMLPLTLPPRSAHACARLSGGASWMRQGPLPRHASALGYAHIFNRYLPDRGPFAPRARLRGEREGPIAPAMRNLAAAFDQGSPNVCMP
jgi:hypothetical protein